MELIRVLRPRTHPKHGICRYLPIILEILEFFLDKSEAKYEEIMLVFWCKIFVDIPKIFNFSEQRNFKAIEKFEILFEIRKRLRYRSRIQANTID